MGFMVHLSHTPLACRSKSRFSPPPRYSLRLHGKNPTFSCLAELFRSVDMGEDVNRAMNIHGNAGEKFPTEALLRTLPPFTEDQEGLLFQPLHADHELLQRILGLPVY